MDVTSFSSKAFRTNQSTTKDVTCRTVTVIKSIKFDWQKSAFGLKNVWEKELYINREDKVIVTISDYKHDSRLYFFQVNRAGDFALKPSRKEIKKGKDF